GPVPLSLGVIYPYPTCPNCPYRQEDLAVNPAGATRPAVRPRAELTVRGKALWAVRMTSRGHRGHDPPGQLVHPAQRVGQPEWAGHRLDERGSVGSVEPGGGDVQRLERLPAPDRDRVNGGTECRLGHTDHGNGQCTVDIRAQPRAPLRIEVDVPVHYEQV